MAQRQRLGLIFKVDKGWMGGTYYILNLINSFNYLEDSEKPAVVLLCADKSDYDYAKKYTDYPYLEYEISLKKLNITQKIINKVSRIFLKRNLFARLDIKCDVEVVFPVMNPSQIHKGYRNIGWIPDFQEKYLPEFFTQKDIEGRDTRTKKLRESGITIIFSSNDAKNDYLELYNAQENKTAVFQFTSKIPAVSSDDKEILKKYDVERNNYFFCGNQFWAHKNHMVLFQAINILKKDGYSPTLLCTGNPTDTRAKDFFKQLQAFIATNHLEDNIKILGLIDRNEQLALMKNARCIVQPSLFEGWNTSIEEAKALNKFIIASDLDVHKEQIVRNGILFRRDSAEDLSGKLKSVIEAEIAPEIYDYSRTIRKAAQTFIDIIKS